MIKSTISEVAIMNWFRTKRRLGKKVRRETQSQSECMKTLRCHWSRLQWSKFPQESTEKQMWLCHFQCWEWNLQMKTLRSQLCAEVVKFPNSHQEARHVNLLGKLMSEKKCGSMRRLLLDGINQLIYGIILLSNQLVQGHHHHQRVNMSLRRHVEIGAFAWLYACMPSICVV